LSSCCSLGVARAPAAGLAECDNPITSEQRNSILRYLRTIDIIEADDAIQEAMVSYIVECRKGTLILNPASWLRTTAKNYLLNIKRGDRRRATREAAAVVSPLDELGLRSSRPNHGLKLYLPDILDGSQTLAERLSEEKLTALYGKYVEDLSAGEIAARDGVPLTTIQGRLRRGERVLGNVVADVLPPPPPLPPSVAVYVPQDHSSGGVIALLLLIALGMVWGIVAWRREQRVKWEWDEFAAAAARAEAARAENMRNWHYHQQHQIVHRYLVAR
jgi:DNA-directed RNA polymerase specialized sigma24 family protein